MKKDLETQSFATVAEWRTWLKKHHASSSGLWLKLAKKATGIASITYAEALEQALIWGWIDGQKATFDDKHWLQRFTPRGPKSIWSKINVGKAEALIASGQMQKAGLEAVELAKKDGRWARAYHSPSVAKVPDELLAALAKNKRAKTFFESLSSANRYAFLHRIQTAKKEETRKKHVEKCVDMCAKGETYHPERQLRSKRS